MKLNQFLSNKAVTEFNFTKVDYIVSEGNAKGEGKGKKIATLWLEKPIDEVVGSMTINDEASGESEKIRAYDITSVLIHEDDFSADGITVNDDGTGSVKSNLRLDVSTKGEVWLKSTSFASFRAQQSAARGMERKSGLLKNMSDNKARSLLRRESENVKVTNPTAVVGATIGAEAN